MKYLFGSCLLLLAFATSAGPIHVLDVSRQRLIPIEIVLPETATNCTTTNRCNVAFISAGNRVPFTKYQFVSRMLNNMGYMTVAVDHELPGDPPLSRTGDLYQTRIENWQRGADTLHFLQQALTSRFPTYDFNKLTLIGHSNGGDISTWLSNEGKEYVYQLITLDHKRVSLPKTANIKVLSLQATEYPTQHGILLTIQEQQQYGTCIVELAGAKHMDLSDYGSNSVIKQSEHIISGFINGSSCETLKNGG